MSPKIYFAVLEELYNNVVPHLSAVLKLISCNHSITRIISFTKKRFKTEINCFCIRTLKIAGLKTCENWADNNVGVFFEPKTSTVAIVLDGPSQKRSKCFFLILCYKGPWISQSKQSWRYVGLGLVRTWSMLCTRIVLMDMSQI